MSCDRCRSHMQIVLEYFDFNDNFFVRDRFCSQCNSALVERFYESGKYSSDWIDLRG